MRYSELFCPTLREVPSEAEIVSHQLLLRAGYVRKSGSGIYSYLPMAYRVLKKIMNIIREEMDAAGGQELMMPIIQPRELWEKSGRWSVYGDEMFRLKDRHSRDFALGPTHEELITTLVDADTNSYRDLPLMLYQIQNKYRDEIRPRFGVMRGREFIMKDLYSFDLDWEGLRTSYQKMYQAYSNIFSRLGLEYRVVEADSGAIGGSESHEFVVLANSGESVIVHCSQCEYAANVEKARAIAGAPVNDGEAPGELERMHTPGQRTIADLAALTGYPEARLVKTLMMEADGDLVAVVIRGDRELNDIKLKNFLNVNELFMAGEERVRDLCGCGFGSLGPIGMPVPVYADLEIEKMVNTSCGANEDDYHYMNVNPGRDFKVIQYVDFRNAVAGDPCPVCGQDLKETRGIEAGHIFQLGTKYSEALQARYVDREGNHQLMVMGCYGIGVSRTMAASIEQNHDEQGIIWPLPIAPYQVIVIPVNAGKADQFQAAEKIYRELTAAGVEAILDDRDERAGVKFKDADLIGIPMRITVGPRSLAEGKVEFKERRGSENELVPVEQIKERILSLISGNGSR